jgi:hypothetical protein
VTKLIAHARSAEPDRERQSQNPPSCPRSA